MKKNLGVLLEEKIAEEYNVNDSFSVAYNPELSNSTRMKLNSLIKKCKKARRELWQ